MAVWVKKKQPNGELRLEVLVPTGNGLVSTLLGNYIHGILCPLQVIYKKFQIPCPLPDRLSNSTGHLNYTSVSTSSYQNDHATVQAIGEDVCSSNLFMLNSQVRGMDLQYSQQ